NIRVYDGSSTGSRLLGTYCSSRNTIFYSTGRYLTVHFTSDGIVTFSGFSAYYREVGPCGGSLFGSGTFSSPNYPSYYYDNSYCVWQLRASHDQRIYLAFTFLQLENCCSCDHISVYDGPSIHSPQLGRVCNNNTSLSAFFSTSNYMTVVFQTDSSVVARGFTAEFLSSLKPNSVDCSSDSMHIVLDRSYLNSLGYDGHSLYLRDPYCRPQISYYNVVFSFPLNTCGNVMNDRIVYTNNIYAYSSIHGEITRQSQFKMNVTCIMEQDSISQIMFVADTDLNTTITGSGRYNTSMDFYTSSSFYNKVTQVPYEVSVNENLYVQVDLRRGDSSLVVFIDTCVTSPSPFDFYSRPYFLVKDGSGSRPLARFSFKAFQFLRATDEVYMQCKVLICPASDYNSRCRRGCRRRNKRSLGSNHDSQTLVVGPIKLKGQFAKNDKEHKATVTNVPITARTAPRTCI
uniref:CUB and zona pellucida-like domains 1, tandem duplicate 1 n=1 Tax=Oryzias latipes TaxID=8090 RepID=A0A3P9M1F5_ORYLA